MNTRPHTRRPHNQDRAWDVRPSQLLTSDQALAKALVEWSENWSSCNAAFINQATYLRTRVLVLSCERLSDEQIARTM